jgi:hypothetical protein
MNSTFASHIEAVPRLFGSLTEALPFIEKGLATQCKRGGIYAFFENDAPQHVGRTRNLQQRLRGDISANHYTGTFAFKMARRKKLGLPATYIKVGAWAQLQNDPIFRPEFLRQIERIKAMPVRFVEIADPIHQYLVELHAHLEYGLRLDEFDTH